MIRRVLYLVVSAFLIARTVFAQDVARIGNDLIAQGKLDEAIALLKPHVDSNPRDLDAAAALCDAYIRVNKTAEAQPLADMLVLRKGKEPRGYILSAQILGKQNNFSEAIRVLNKGMKPTNNDPLLLLQLGYTYIASDSAQRAVATFLQANMPDDAGVQLGLAEAYEKLGSIPTAIQHYEKAIAIDSSRIETRFRLAELYTKTRKYAEAGRVYNGILRVKPGDETAANELSKIYFLSKQFANVVKVLEAHVRNNPDDKERRSMYVESAMNTRQYDALVQMLEPLIAKNILDQREREAYVESLFRSGNFQKAIQEAQSLLQTWPESVPAMAFSARSNYLTNNYTEATSQFIKLSARDTLTADDHKMLGRAFLFLKQDSLAALYLEKSVTQDASQNEVSNDLGTAYMRMKQFEKAAEMFKKRMEQDTAYVAAYVNYALCSLALSRWDEARRVLGDVIAKRPNYIPGHLNLARCFAQMDSLKQARAEYETFLAFSDTLKERYMNERYEAFRYGAFSFLVDKNYPKALDALTLALAIKGSDPEVHLWRAQTLHALSRKEDARKEYEIVLRLKPDSKEAQKGLEILRMLQ